MKQRHDVNRTASYRPNLFRLEKMIETDMVTRDALIRSISASEATQKMALIAAEEIQGGYKYKFVVKHLDLKMEAEIIDKLGTEYGFGGCFIKLIKIKGSKKSFYHWCTIIQNLIDDIEDAYD